MESLNQLNEYVKLDSMMIPDVVRRSDIIDIYFTKITFLFFRADQDINPSLYREEPTASVESS